MWSSKRPAWKWFGLMGSVLLLACLAQGCGYQFAASAPIDLPEGMTRLYFRELVNPSTEPRLEPKMRSEIREELSRRGQVQWVERTEAEGLVEVDITRYSSSAKLEDSRGETVKSEVVLQITASIFRQVDEELVWRSGSVSASKSYVGPEEGPQQREALDEAIELVVERLADRMSQSF